MKLGGIIMAIVKTKRTYYTDEKIAAAKKNILNYKWAREKKDFVVQKAEKYLSYGYDMIWDLVTSQKLPRSYGVNQTLGCPICGKGVDKYGNYPYDCDTIGNPWKITCPNCKSVFPSNDFGAYYKSGLDNKGFFEPELADRSLLKNILYPEKGENYLVDDGYGWLDPDNDNRETRRYTFISYINHWHIWDGYVNSKFCITGALNAFSKAYLFTGDTRYAAASAVLLDRIADIYPDMDSGVYKWEDGFRNSHGLSGLGKAIGSIWETGLVTQIVGSYDAVFDGINQPDVVAFLKLKKAQYPGITGKNSIEDIKENIEKGILRQIYPGVKSGQILGNVGMHQSALILAAVVLQDDEVLQKSLDYIFRSIEMTEYRGKENIMHILVDDVDRDGHGDEASPGYNSIWMNCIKLVADILDGYKGDVPDLYNNVKFRKLFHMVHPLVILDNYTPSIGDTKVAGNPGIICDLQAHSTSFLKTNDINVAQIVYLANGNKVEGICKDIFSDCEMIENKVLNVIKEYGPLSSGSTNVTGYGFSALKTGLSDAQRALMMYYGRNTGHGHRDTLNISLYAFGVELTPDHGYPCFADRNLERRVWTVNTISHNTVSVDKQVQKNNVVGIPHHYDGLSDVMLIDVEAPAVYPDVDLYRRTSAFIKINESSSYMVDFFRIDGGNEHLFSFHGGEGEVVVEGLKLEAQGEGTYAGKDVKLADTVYSATQPDGYNYLYNVSRDNAPASKFSIDWAVKDTWKIHKDLVDMHVKLTMVSQCNDIAIADGQPPQNKVGNPKCYKYLLAHRAESNLKSQFTSIIEPYMNDSHIISIEAVEVRAGGNIVVDNHVSAVKVVLKDDRTDYIINSLDTGIVYEVDNVVRFSGFLGICSLINGKPVYAYVNDGSLLEYAGNKLIETKFGSLTGKVVDFTKALSIRNEILVDIENVNKSDVIDWFGKYIYIKNDGVRNGSYKIEGAVKISDCKYLLNIGDVTLIREIADTKDMTKGYIYDIDEAGEFYIPIGKEWRSK